MTLAQVQATFGLVAFMIATWAGLVIAVALLMPKHVARSESRIGEGPFRSFFTGLALLIPTVISLIMLQSPIGLLKLIGFFGLTAISAALAVGASGMALLMGRRISEMTGSNFPFSALVRGSVIYSLALGFPIIGWFLFLPIALIVSLGAGAQALIQSTRTATPPLTPNSRSEYDILERQGAV